MTKSIFTPSYRIFLQALIQTRKNQGITQTILARKLKKPQSYVSKFESAERRLDIIETREILLALKTSPIHFWEMLEKELS